MTQLILYAWVRNADADFTTKGTSADPTDARKKRVTTLNLAHFTTKGSC
jgi:hypothetical protein